MGHGFVLLGILVILTGTLSTAVRLASRGYAICGALVGVGSLGFLAPWFLPDSGIWLQHVELPAIFETISIVGPEGRTFAATIPWSRIQRYDADGRFETGWFVDSGGKSFAIGLTAEGRIAVAAGRKVEFFKPDGSTSGLPQPFTKSGGFTDRVLRPSNFQVEGVTFVDPVQAGIPRVHWVPLVLFPLWHPIIGWLFVVAGVVVPWADGFPNQRSDGQPS